jgi:hypothetical protein
MADVVKPEQFNEKFTLYLNTDGQPVQRTLREMTAGEVMQALQWHDDEVARLQREAEPACAIGRAAEEGRSADVAHLTDDELRAASTALTRYSEAAKQLSRLMTRVIATVPPQAKHLPLPQALRRYRSGGRAA